MDYLVKEESQDLKAPREGVETQAYLDLKEMLAKWESVDLKE